MSFDDSPFNWLSETALSTKAESPQQRQKQQQQQYHRPIEGLSITKQSHNSTVASIAQQQQLPLQTDGKTISSIDIAAVRRALNNEKRARFDEVFAVSFRPRSFTASSSPPPLSQLHPSVSDRLVESGIITRVSNEQELAHPTRSQCRAFTVVESKLASDGSIFERQRFILWPRQLNEWQESNYTPSVDLLHSSKYVDGVFEEAALTGDIENGFYGIEVPHYARALFRFRDSNGRLFEMLRLPMGLRSSVELMHIVTKTLVGHRDFVTPQRVLQNINPRVFVDDFCIPGPAARLDTIIPRILQNAAEFNIRLKEPLGIKTSYVFLGFAFDHSARSIAVGPKTDSKLPDIVPLQLAAAELQRLVARLIWCSGGLRIPLAMFFFAMKWATRVCNKLNTGAMDPQTVVSLPLSVQQQLEQWLQAVRLPFFIRHRAIGQHAVLFTDASLSGWGAYLIMPDQRLYIAGARWNVSATSDDICLLEALAVNKAITTFAHLILPLRNIDLRIDNTSVVSAIPRGVARASSLNEALRDVYGFFRLHNIQVTAQYVCSAENIADALSRGQQPLPLTREQVATFLHERRGAGGVWSEI